MLLLQRSPLGVRKARWTSCVCDGFVLGVSAHACTTTHPRRKSVNSDSGLFPGWASSNPGCHPARHGGTGHAGLGRAYDSGPGGAAEQSDKRHPADEKCSSVRGVERGSTERRPAGGQWWHSATRGSPTPDRDALGARSVPRACDEYSAYDNRPRTYRVAAKMGIRCT